MDRVDEDTYYWNYLHLDDLLSAQEPLSGRGGIVAHDEHLFMVVHQSFELWFKQILVELDDALGLMGQDVIAEDEIGIVHSRLLRIITIQRLLLAQIDVLETMTPLDYLDLRDLLTPASGAQSIQFRLIEIKFGLDVRHRQSVNGSPYGRGLSSEHSAVLEACEQERSLHDHVERWLRRTPFLTRDGYDFCRAYREP